MGTPFGYSPPPRGFARHWATRPSPLLRRQTAFTLIELLVVIAIIGILAGMLMPALTASRERARISGCRSNLRQLLMAAQMYAQGHDEFLPVEDAPHNPHLNLMTCLAPYCGDGAVFYCPSAVGELGQSKENAERGYISYFCFSYNNYKKNKLYVRWLIEGECILTTRSKPKVWVFSDYLWKDKPGNHSTYQKGINYARLDGSIDFIVMHPRDDYEEAFDIEDEGGGGGGGGGG